MTAITAPIILVASGDVGRYEAQIVPLPTTGIILHVSLRNGRPYNTENVNATEAAELVNYYLANGYQKLDPAIAMRGRTLAKVTRAPRRANLVLLEGPYDRFCRDARYTVTGARKIIYRAPVSLFRYNLSQIKRGAL